MPGMTSTPDAAPALRIAPCSAADLRRLEQIDTGPHLRFHNAERFGMQEKGEAVYLLAWRGEALVGRVSLLARSKYPEVAARFPGLSEINALAAFPAGQGTGTALIRAALTAATERGDRMVGLAVDHDNPEARRLYERLGWELVPDLEIVDEWDDITEDGPGEHYADPCSYLVRALDGGAR